MTTNQTKFNIRLSHDRNQWVDLDLKYFDDQGYPGDAICSTLPSPNTVAIVV